jgi:hypothetical protein
MPINNAIEKRVAIMEETVFAEASLPGAAAIDWDALVSPEGLLAVTEAQTESLKRAYIENENITVRAADVHPKIRGVLSGATSQIASYIYGARSGHAAAEAQAEDDALDLILRSGLGGSYNGFAADLVGGTAALPEVDVGQGANLDPWMWGYFVDVSTGLGYFRLIESVAGDVLTMAPGHTLPFVPAVGDTMRATKARYFSPPVNEDPGHASHTTLAMLLAGANPEDLYELRGVKPDLQFGPIEQGAPTKVTFPIKLCNFAHEGLGPFDLAYTLQGSPGTVVGAGTRTTCWMSPADTLLATQQFWGAITPNLAVEHAAIMGPNGNEGVHGWGLAESSYKTGGVDLAVPFDASWRAAAEAETEYHLLIQVGNAITDGVWGLYFPRLSFNEDAGPGEDDNRRRQSNLQFMARERQDASLLALAEDVRERARAKWILLRLG